MHYKLTLPRSLKSLKRDLKTESTRMDIKEDRQTKVYLKLKGKYKINLKKPSPHTVEGNEMFFSRNIRARTTITKANIDCYK